jgi:hypothetical protein
LSAKISARRAAARLKRKKKKMGTSFELIKKMGTSFELILKPHVMQIFYREQHVRMHFYNDGPGQVYVEAHNILAGSTADPFVVQDFGQLLLPGQVTAFSGLGPLTLSSVDDQGATVIVKTALTS